MVENANFDTEITNQFKKNPITVTEYAYNEDQNMRQYMEDKHFIKDHIFYDDPQLKQHKIGLFGVLDGHGGQDIVKHCTENIPIIFKQKYAEDNNKDPLQLFSEIFEQVDIILRRDKGDLADEQGSCCCIAMVKENICNVMNLGDTRAVLFQNGVVQRVSVDHKASNQDEIQRVQQAGGVIFRGRVSGNLAVTRALGDLSLKKEGVICIPYIQKFEFKRNNNEFLIIASDGLWDVIEDQAAVDLIKDDLLNNKKTIFESSALLKDHALQNGSRDNVSVMIIKF